MQVVQTKLWQSVDDTSTFCNLDEQTHILVFSTVLELNCNESNPYFTSCINDVVQSY